MFAMAHFAGSLSRFSLQSIRRHVCLENGGRLACWLTLLRPDPGARGSGLAPLGAYRSVHRLLLAALSGVVRGGPGEGLAPRPTPGLACAKQGEVLSPLGQRTKADQWPTLSEG